MEYERTDMLIETAISNSEFLSFGEANKTSLDWNGLIEIQKKANWFDGFQQENPRYTTDFSNLDENETILQELVNGIFLTYDLDVSKHLVIYFEE